MIKIKTDIQNQEQIDFLLKVLQKDAIADRDIKAALRQLAKPLIETMKQKTPKKTGVLRKSIGVIKGVRSQKGRPFILVGPRYYSPFDGYHAHLVEVGREKYNVEYAGVKMIANAYAEKKDWIQQKLAIELVELLKRKVKRLGL
tara:strand:- start:8707 stop:9138 length:432 start_codon:yes stop_codon:yes gene_type:complete